MKYTRSMPMKTIHRIFLEDELDKIIPTLKGETILDMGAKDMRYAHYFENSKYIAIDLEPKIKNNYMIQADAHNLPFPDNTFDIIISTEVIEHTTWPWIVIQELSRILKPGGSLVISWPWLYAITHHDYWRIHIDSMKKLAEKNNLRIEFSIGVGGSVTNISMGLIQIIMSRIKINMILKIVFSILYKISLIDKKKSTKKDASGFIAVMRKQSS